MNDRAVEEIMREFFALHVAVTILEYRSGVRELSGLAMESLIPHFLKKLELQGLSRLEAKEKILMASEWVTERERWAVAFYSNPHGAPTLRVIFTEDVLTDPFLRQVSEAVEKIHCENAHD